MTRGSNFDLLLLRENLNSRKAVKKGMSQAVAEGYIAYDLRVEF